MIFTFTHLYYTFTMEWGTFLPFFQFRFLFTILFSSALLLRNTFCFWHHFLLFLVSRFYFGFYWQ